jgi:two-component system CheB/CheR fusion protein
VSAVRPEPIEFPSSFAPALSVEAGSQGRHKPYLNLQVQAEQLVLRRHAPPTVLVNDQGNILFISGRTGKYLEPAVGKANLNIFAMAREGLRYELTNAFRKALRQAGPVTLRGLKIGTNGGQQYADITVERLDDAEPLAGLVMIVFLDISAPAETKAPAKAGKKPSGNQRLAEVERELHRSRAELQNMMQEMQNSQEELKSNNEEMQSTNEEMQSTNEELTTSKEELQSLNEELQTVNAELQGKLDELSRANNDMKNLLNSTDVATLFLANDLKVRRFTTQATRIIKLIPGDVGRPITDLASDLLYPELADDAREVLRKLGFIEKPISARDGSWFTVRIMPYRTLDDRIDGVVITFLDISVAKTLEGKMQNTQTTLENRLAGQSAKLDKARVALKAERNRSRKDGGQT